MRTDVMLVPAVRRGSRRGPALPGLAPILAGVLILTGWMALVNPLTSLPAVFREGASASADTLLMALFAVAGLVAVGLFGVAVTVYVAAMRSLRRTR